MTVIVTYARNRIALTIARSLAKKGIKVITSDNIRPAMSSFSRYSKGHFQYTSPMQNPQEFVNQLISKAKSYEAEVIIPAHEETFIISKYKHYFDEEGIRVPVADYDAIMTTHNKAESAVVAEKTGIPVPRTRQPVKIEEVMEIAKEMKFPLVIKLRKSRGSIGVAYANTASELVELYKKTVEEFSLEPENYPLIQEYISGTGIGVSMLFNRGQLQAKFTHKRLLEFPVTGGTSVERISISMPEAEEYAERLLSHMNWHGVAMVEFKVDKATEKPYFLEINPRFWGSLNQAVCAGVDFPYLLYRMAMDEPIDPVTEYKLGVKTLWFFGYVRALMDYMRTPQRWRALKETLHFFDRNMHFDDIFLTDPLPFLMEPVFALQQLITKGKLTFETDDETVKSLPF